MKFIFSFFSFFFDLLKGALKLPMVILGSPLPVTPFQILMQLATAIWHCLTDPKRIVLVLLILIGSWVFCEQLVAELVPLLEPYSSLFSAGGLLFTIPYVWLVVCGILVGSRFDSSEKIVYVYWWTIFAAVVLCCYCVFIVLFSIEI